EESIEEKVEGISEEVKKLKEDKRELKAKQGLGKQLTGLIFGKVKIEEKDISEFLDEFELSLLEGDVEQDTALQIILELKKEMIGKEVKKSEDLGEFLKKEIKNAMAKVMETEEVNLLEKIQGKKPFIIMMLGPNGAGKTTSIAKLTYMFQQNKKKVVLASADTFRAGSIEQIETHAERLGARVVKHKYGADPAAVAFDAVKAAESEKADVVLIDTAGRQETNKNLMEELKKIKRVVKPDFTIFVGESLAGQSFLSQAEKFSSELGIDGFILTKIDTDAKGGTAISLLYKIKKPILYVGTGQDYKDLEKFTPEFVLDRII
ncbi:MAG: signal recognition particle-docking protein FtsY, partial [Candidatus Diapherotrites archaeon]|nr:signal recognition particle-docking protein FtsY [Candidatus Diapherotrites archaeon]